LSRTAPGMRAHFGAEAGGVSGADVMPEQWRHDLQVSSAS